MVLKSIDKHRYLLHFLSVLLGLQVLHKNLGGPEVFLADCAGGDGCSAGKLRREGQVKLLELSIYTMKMCLSVK